MYKCGYARKNGVGEVSSKYGYPGGGERFERDILEKKQKSEALYEEFVAWMKEREINPQNVRLMFIRFYDEFISDGGENEA